MTRPAAGRTAFALWVVFVLIEAAAILLLADTPGATRPEGMGASSLSEELFNLPGTVAFASVGALVIARRPRHPIGWIFLAFGLQGAVLALTSGWARLDLISRPEELGAGAIMAWLNTWIDVIGFALLVLVLLLFPTGRVAGPRWRTALLLTVVWTVSATATAALGPLVLPFSSATNPVAIGDSPELLAGLREPLYLIGLPLFLAAAASLVLRLRRSQGVERAQIKWFVYAVVLLGLASFARNLVPTDGAVAVAIADTFEALLYAMLPVSVGIAILRHRLFDIDAVISRTLVYGGLTATLVGSYLACVLLFQLILSPLTEQSDLAIAGSTLAVAALFRPVRRRIQGLVDRRFYRRRYDAARTLERFGARLRDEVDLDALGGDLRGVVRETVQPVHVSLWLRTPEVSR